MGAANIGPLAVATVNIQPDAVTATEVAPSAIYPSHLYRPLTSNLVKDYDLIEEENLRFTEFLTSAGTGTEVPMLDANVVQMDNPSTDAIGPSNYKFRLTAPAISYTLRVETDRLSPVEEGLWYEFSCYLSPKVAWSTVGQVTMRAMWWTIDSSGDIVALSESASSTFGTLGTSPFFSKGFQAPSNAVYASLKMSIQAASGQLVEQDFTSPKIRQLPIYGDYTDFQQKFVGTATTFGNTTGTVLIDVTGAFKKNIQSVKSIEAVGRFKNASGAAGDYTVSVEYSIKGSGIWNTFGDPYTTSTIGNGAPFTGFFSVIPVSGVLSTAIDTVDFRLVADPDQAGNDLRQKYLSVRVFYS